MRGRILGNKVHFQALIPPTKDYMLMLYIIDGEVTDMHLMVNGEFKGHISDKMWQIIQEDQLQALPSMLAAAEFCGDVECGYEQED